MKSIIFLMLVVLAAALANDVNLKLLPELDNTIEADSLPKPLRKFLTIAKKPKEIVFQRGAPVELVCEGIGVPAPTIRWFRNDAPVYEHNLESNEIIEPNPTSLARVKSTLLIPRTEDQDEYTCVVSAGFKTAKAKTIVYNIDDNTNLPERTRLFPLVPKILVYYKVLIDTMGNNVVLPCKVKGHPRPQITWEDNKGNIVRNNRRMKVLRSGDLVITSLHWSDLGDFTCRAENVFGTQNVTTFIYPAKAG